MEPRPAYFWQWRWVKIANIQRALKMAQWEYSQLLYMTEGSELFSFWLKISTLSIFFESRDRSHLFLGLKVCWLNKWVLTSWNFFFLAEGNFDARYFFGCKFSDSCIFGGFQYEAPLDLSVMYTASTPPQQKGGWCFAFLIYFPVPQILWFLY